LLNSVKKSYVCDTFSSIEKKVFRNHLTEDMGEDEQSVGDL
jgi:hypothetical protein